MWNRDAGVALSRYLPFRHHDVINWPLPGLRGFLIDLAPHDPALTQRLIAEAAESLGQQKPARDAQFELQARSLEQAARDADWHRAQTLALPFMPSLADLPQADPLRRYADAAENLAAASIGGDQRRRASLLRQAEAQLTGQGISLIGAPMTPDPRTPRLLAVNRVWKEAIQRARARLDAEVAANPQLPRVYVTGPALDPRDPDAVRLFRARSDLIGIIDHDLADDRRATLLLIGQRRMGKTSLLRMLPAHLGNQTVLAVLDFQGLSGSGHGMAPHRWVCQALRDAISDAIDGISLPSLPEGDAWGALVDWMASVEDILASQGRRALVAVDEVERIQTGIDEGWSTPVFLDFARAAGDRLRHIRLLLVSAHPPSRLGARWSDRLISALARGLGTLPMDDAEDLLRRPVPDFPAEVFDDAAAAAALAMTGGHPYLIQLVGDEVVKRLNAQKRRAATAKDVRRALDTALVTAGQSLFPDLWQVLSDTERALLRSLARGEAVSADSAAFRNLRGLDYVIERDGMPAYAFPLFGRWVRDHAPLVAGA